MEENQDQTIIEEQPQISDEFEQHYKNYPVSDHRITSNYTMQPVGNTQYSWTNNDTGEEFIGNIDEFNEFLKENNN